ncbi:MAG: amidohydrolase [Acidobacteriota bacterium]|nr:amidohydrolase [Acidobacteriota bacterium]
MPAGCTPAVTTATWPWSWEPPGPWSGGGGPALPGRLLLLFQPAEEAGGGARRIVEAGWLDRLKVDFVLGLHLWSFAPLGQAIIPDATVLASSDEFQVRFGGPGGHGALPHETQDVVLAAAHLVVALQGVVSRDVDPVRPAVLTVGRLEAGRAPNVIPRQALVEGTFRAGDGETRARVLHRIGEVAHAIARVHGVDAEVDFGTGYPATVNDGAVAAVYRAAAEEVLGRSGVAAGPPTMASEDFAFYLQRRRGAFCLLGMADEAGGSHHPHHSPAFRVAEAALLPGLEILLLAAWSLMAAPPE